jgi:hypothetical protein
MAVGAYDLALGDLGQNILPVAFSEPGRDTEVLILDMVELQHEHVILPAISAGMLIEMTYQETHSLIHDSLTPRGGIVYVSLAVLEIVLRW